MTDDNEILHVAHHITNSAIGASDIYSNPITPDEAAEVYTRVFDTVYTKISASVRFKNHTSKKNDD